MAVLFCGIALGFVLSTALFIQKIWSMRDRLDEARARERFYKNECLRQQRENVEWEQAQNGAQQSLSRK